ncbi:MAG: tail fiber domain-containing protein [bacterium]
MKRSTLSMAVAPVLALTVLAAAPAAVAQSSITCGPLDNGRVADVFYKSDAVFFDPAVKYEYERAVLTVSGPCETLTKTFKPGEEIFFDLREVERTLDGQYEWELRFMPAVDPGVRKDLQASRGTGEEDDLWWNYWQKGAIPDGPSVDSAGFTVVKGSIIDPSSDEERQKSATVATKDASAPLAAATGGIDASDSTGSEATGTGGGGNVLATKDTVLTNADGVIRNSLCVGFDCLNDNTYSDSTILLRENNTRIKFDDTSTASSFPRRDWEIQANSNANGGGSWLAINDCGESSGDGCAEDPVFLVEGNSPANSIRVDSSGRVGFGTSNPIVELHAVSGDSPTLRLDQNTSLGFGAQVWDIAGNETSFFVRDATNGSTLPFRIRPGASSNSLVIDSDDDVGVGTLSPQKPVHIVRGTNPGFRLQDNSGTGASNWDFELNGNGLFQINRSGTGGPEVLIRERADGTGGLETMDVDGSIEADAFNVSSSRNFKTDVELIDGKEILARVAELPVSAWAFKWDESGTRHIGPMAEDFMALFSVGRDSTNISVGDAAGVALAAIQGLYEELQAKEKENSDLRARQERLEARLEVLEEKVGPAAAAQD